MTHPRALIYNLELTDASLTSIGLNAISRGVAQSKSLISLNLSGNNFGAET